MPPAPQAAGPPHRMRLPGHPEGEAELRAVLAWARALPDGYQAMVRAFLNPARPAPALFAVQRIR